MPAALDLAGRRFGRLTVLGRSGRESYRPRWLCQCDCGNVTDTPISSVLTSGHTTSCGCRADETRRAKDNKTAKHLRLGTPEYRSWSAMRTRCRNPNATGYERYGGVGVTICERWEDFSAFLEDMGPRPSLDHSLDRWPDPFGNYEPSNCRWATAKQQQNNRRDQVARAG